MGTRKGFTGQYADGTGLDYFNARYYDPTVGLFLSVDSIEGNAQGMNPYAYVGGNPQSRTDPSGQAYTNGGGTSDVGGSDSAPPPPPIDNGGYSPPPVGGGGNLDGGACNRSTCSDGSGYSVPNPTAPNPPVTSTNTPSNGGGSGNGGGSSAGQGSTNVATSTKSASDNKSAQGASNDCNSNPECQRAEASLLALWDQHDAKARFWQSLTAIIGTILAIVASATLKGTLGILSAIVQLAAVLPQAVDVLKNWYTAYAGGKEPDWLIKAAPIVDHIGAVASIVSGLLGFATLTWGLADILAKEAGQLIAGGAMLLVNSILLFVGNNNLFSIDQDTQYRYDLANVWSSDEIIRQCHAQGGAIC